MKYISLKKLFHINEIECNNAYKNRFEGESTHRLGIKLNGYECFYLVNDEILQLIDNIYNIDKWIEVQLSSNLSASSRKYLMLSTLVEEIRSSNKIEGICSTRKEINDIILNKPLKNYIRFYGMVNKYEMIINNKFNEVKSSCELRKLYDEILLQDIADNDENDIPDGVIFRKNQVEINSGYRIIHKGISNEGEIINMMERALSIVNNHDIHLLIRIAIFHYLLEYIHPFYDGNGRMGRFIVCGYLSKRLSVLSALQFSVACLHNQKKYYESFEIVNDVRNKGDLTVFIIYFLEIYLDGLKELKEYIKTSLIAYEYNKKKMFSIYDSKYYGLIDVLLQVTLFGIGEGITMADLVKATNYTQQSLRKMIKEINKEHNIIKVNNKHKPYLYTIDIDYELV